MRSRECKFSEILRDLLDKNKMSQRKLADKIYCEQNTVWKWLNEGSLPNVLLLMEMSRVFDVSIDYLIFGEEGGRWSE